MKLVVVESPAKAKTIKKYLGKDFNVAATMGHVMDLPKSGISVDVDKNYKPEYEVIKNKKKVIRELKKLLPKNDSDVYLALDPDREGEAIAAHVAEVLKLKKPNRVVFHEITKKAVQEAIDNCSNVNENLVEAQKARRILDRLVGYKLSGLLWKKIWYGLSAGRVQSVTTRLIVDREKERDAFEPVEFWEIDAHLKKVKDKGEEFVARLVKKDGKKLVSGSEKSTGDIVKNIEGAGWKVGSVSTKKKLQKPSPPFTTSTLQRLANSYLGYSTKRTMQLAQQLYQGVKVSDKGQIGLITYMRTDSTVLADQAVKSIRKYIGSVHGKEYLPAKPVLYKTKSRLAQEAHEAIRPAHFDLPPAKVKDSLSPQQYKVYELIWNRAVGCQMKPLEYNVVSIDVDANCKSGVVYLFHLEGREVLFDGFAKVVGSRLLAKDDTVQRISGISEGDDLECIKIDTEQRFTKPRARYTEATLVRALEKYGIGRPSTYATIISTIQGRGYVGKDGRYLYPTDVGIVVTDFLIEHFARIVDYDFTSEIEEDLDEVALGKIKWVPVVDKVYKPFEKNLIKKDKEVKKEDVVILGDSKHKCPVCGGKMVERLGRNGKFLSCAEFPKCKGMLGIDGKTVEETFDNKKYLPSEPCEKCGGNMKLKNGRYGQFWACEKYPDCKSTAPLLLQEKCPECGEPLVERKGKGGRSFTGCSGYPDCKYIKKDKAKAGSAGTEDSSSKTKKVKRD